MEKDISNYPSKDLVPLPDANVFLDSGAPVLRKVERVPLFFLAINFVGLPNMFVGLPNMSIRVVSHFIPFPASNQRYTTYRATVVARRKEAL